VFKEMPAGELIEANRIARRNCLKQLLNMMLYSFGLVIKSYRISYTENLTE